MDPDPAAGASAQARHQRLKELFFTALERPAAERETFLGEACGADPTLRAELLDLLRLAEEAGEATGGPEATHASGDFALHQSSLGDVEWLPRGAGLGRYVVLDRIGEGGMGVVYAAYDPELDRRVAVKVLRAGPSRSTGEARLLREAQALARLAHPNVIAVHDVGTVAGRVFIAMEFVAGRSLRQRIDEWAQAGGPLPWREALALLTEAGRGLAAAHRAGLVHRDFKPDNVLVGEDGRVRVLDFGLARARLDSPTGVSAAVELEDAPPHLSPSSRTASAEMSAAATLELPADGPAAGGWTPPNVDDSTTPRRALLASPITHVGTLAGTPGYMAPELFEGQPADPRADQFSFCVTLWEAICGERPHPGANLLEIHESLRTGTIREPAEAATPRWLRAVLLRGLDRDPARRFADMDELLSALRPPDRRRLVRGGIAATVILGSLAVWALARADRDACAGGPVRLAGVWDAARQAVIRDALLATGKPYAPAAWREVERGLEAWARAWSDSYRGTCQAHRRGEASAELLDLRMQCLDRRLEEVAALGEVLVHADGAVVERAAQAVGGLPALDACADAALLRRRQTLPSEPEPRARILDGQRDMARAHALGDAGKWQDGLALATTVEAAARATGYQPLLADSLLVAAQLQERLSQPEAARKSFAAAYVAAEAGGEAAVKVRAAADQARFLGHRLAIYGEADWWLELAAAALGPRPAPLLEASVAASRGVIRRAESRYDEALPSLERALEIRERELGPDHLEVAGTLNSIGNLHNDTGRFAEADVAYARALAIDRARLGNDHPAVARVLNNLGTSKRSQGDFAAANQLLGEALAIYERSLGMKTREVAQTLLNLGNLANDQGNWQQALAHHGRAATLSRELSAERDPLLGQAIHGMANSLISAGRREEAIAQGREALRILEAIQGPEHQSLAFILEGLGGNLADLGRPAEALPFLERSLRIHETNLGTDHPFVGANLAALGILDLRLGNPRRGRERIERALALLAGNTEVIKSVGLAQLELAKLLAGEDRLRALDLAREAERVFIATRAPELDRARAWLRAHEPAKIPKP